MSRDGSRFPAVVVAAPARQAEMQDAVQLAGGAASAHVPWGELDRLGLHLASHPILAIDAEGVDDATLDVALPMLARTIGDAGLRAVVAFAAPQLDIVAAALLIPTVDLLCAPGLREQVAALAMAGRMATSPGLHDRVREDEPERDREIAEAVARFTALLTDVTDRSRRGNGVGDRHMSFGFAPLQAAVTPQAIRQVIRGRRLRDSFLGDDLFEDPAWDMLLDLYAAQLEGRQVSVSSLCIASAVAATTALRWIARLAAGGLVVRHPDPTDRRRAFIELSPRALAGMESYAVALHRAGIPFA